MSLITQILPKKDSENYFIVLGLEEDYVRAAVVEMKGNKAKILGTGKSDIASPGHESEAADVAVTMAEKSLPEELLTESVIFALPQIFLEGEGVKTDYEKKLKKISRELNLRPYGFVDYNSAVSNYLEETEGAPATVLTLELSKGFLTVTLIRIGKIQKYVTIERTDSLVSDFAKALPKFATEILPSKIIIFEGHDKAEEVREELLKFPWHKHSIFMHTPKVEIFDNEKILTAIVEASATRFVPEEKTAEESKTEQPETEEEKEEKTYRKIEEREETEMKQEEAAEEKKEESNVAEANKDSGIQIVSEKVESSSDRFGFTSESLADKAQELKRETAPRRHLDQSGKPAGGKIVGVLQQLNLTDKRNKITQVIQKYNFGRLLILLPIALLVIFILIGVWAYPTATVSILTYPESQSESQNLVFVKDAGENTLGEMEVKTRSITDEVEGTKTAKTTGTSQIGERAKGEVTIYNKTLSSKNLPMETVLSSGGLNFSLDEEIKVASASETTEGITFGKTSAKVSAIAIGPDSNLAAGSNFTFKDYSENSLSAKNSQPFSGGTSREIASVSKEDRDNLEEALTKELISQSRQKLVKQLSASEQLLDEPADTQVSAKKFSAEVGSEAKELTLDMTLKIEALAYNRMDLNKLSENQNPTPPNGYKLDPSKKNVRVKDTSVEKNGNVKATVIVTSYFIPDLDLSKILEAVKGKTYNEVISYLEKTDKIAGVKITPERKLPFLASRLPFSPANIKVLLVSR